MTRYPRSIFVHLPFEMGFVRHIFLGVQSEAMRTEGWDVFTDTDGSFRRHAEIGIKEGAVIGFISEEHNARQVRSFAKVALNVSNRLPPHPLTCSVINDDAEIGRVAARHFLGLGHRALHYCASWTNRYAEERWEGYAEEARAAGARAERVEEGFLRAAGQTGRLPAGMEFPLAIFAENDALALRLLRECKQAGFSVPGDVSLLGVDDDELLVESVVPQISSVRPAGHAIGVAATRLIISGEARPGMVVRIPPEGVITRMSTNLHVMGDSRLRKALAFMDAHFKEALDFDEVARVSGLGRRNFQALFRRHVGVSPARWIDQRRLNEAKRLLKGTSLSQEKIAELCGFGSAINFWRCFRRLEKKPPGEYRKSL